MTEINLINRPELSNYRYPAPQAMADGVKTYLNAHENDFKLKATAGFLRLVVKNIEQAVHAKENGNFCAVHSTLIPIEFFWPLGIMPLFNRLYSTIAGIIGNDNRNDPPLSDDIGVSCCRRSIPPAPYGMDEFGVWPAADFAVYDGSPCPPTPWSQETAAKRMGIPSFRLDHPSKAFTPQSMNYCLAEHRALIRFLEEQTGRKMDVEYLKEVALMSYRATQIYNEIDELRKAVPCPMPAEAAFAPMAVHRAWAGTQTCIDYFEQLRDELQERVNKGIGAVPRERFRYTFAAGLPLCSFVVMSETEKRFGAVNVRDHLRWWRDDADWLIDSDDPVASISYRLQFATPSALHGTAMDLAEEVRQAALTYKIDCVVHFSNLGCRHAAGGHRPLNDALGRSPDLPAITVNCDGIDGSRAFLDKVMDQLGRFLESVEQSEAYSDRIRQRGQQAR